MSTAALQPHHFSQIFQSFNYIYFFFDHHRTLRITAANVTVRATHPVNRSGEDGEQTGRRAPAAGRVGRRTGDRLARGHVPPVQIGQFGRGRARHVPRTVDRPRRQSRLELQLGDNRGDGVRSWISAYSASVLRHGHRDHGRDRAVLHVAVFAAQKTHPRKSIRLRNGLVRFRQKKNRRIRDVTTCVNHIVRYVTKKWTTGDDNTV